MKKNFFGKLLFSMFFFFKSSLQKSYRLIKNIFPDHKTHFCHWKYTVFLYAKVELVLSNSS